MKHYRGVLIIGIIEILIGGITLLATFGSLLLGTNTKAPNVLIFVIAASLVSTSLGIGILLCRKMAYQLLLYFSSVVLLSKLLILMGIFHLTGALETTIPPLLKNVISILYHGGVVLYLIRPNIKQIFHVD